jgi:hypothetical protein
MGREFMYNRLLLPLLATLAIAGCSSTPDTVMFNGRSVGTYGPSAGCSTLGLDQDCSMMSGATREIEIEGTALRVSGGNRGRTILVMSMPKITPDQFAIKRGATQLEAFLRAKGIEIQETKVIYANDILFGVRYQLSGDGYSAIKELHVD